MSILGAIGSAFGLGPGSAPPPAPTFNPYTVDPNGMAARSLGQQQTTANSMGVAPQAKAAQAGFAGYNPGASALQQQQQQQSRGAQTSALGILGQSAMGNGPSAAQGMLNQGESDAIHAQLALANSAQGNPAAQAAAQRAAAQGVAQQMPAAANQAAQLRAQEMQAAQAQYAGQANALQSSDQGALGLGQQQGQFQQNQANQQMMGNAGLLSQTNVANMQGADTFAGLQNTAMNNVAQNNLGLEQIREQGATAPFGATASAYATQMGRANNQANAGSNFLGGLIGGGAAAMGAGAAK